MHIKRPLISRGRCAQVLGELGHRAFAADFYQDVVHVDRVRSRGAGRRSGFRILRLSVERNLGKVAIRQRAAFDGGEGGALLLQTLQRLLDFLVGHRSIRLVGAQLLIVFDPDGRHHFKAGFEAQGFAIVDVQIGYARLRNRGQPQLFGFFAEISRNQRVDYVALDAFGKTLLDHGGGSVSGTESGDAGQFLVFLDQGLGFAGHIGRRDFHLDLPFGATAGFSGAHVYLSVCPPAVSGACANSVSPQATGVHS